MNFSGLVLDLYDDPSALKEIYSGLEEVPEQVKTAHALSSSDRDQLPDYAFALVMLDEGHKIRKYACVDPGNTILSIEYFLKNGHKLPIEAQKTAAVNLVQACGWYDIQPPEILEKVAIGPLGLLHLGLVAPSAAGQAKRQIGSNMAAARAAGGTVMTPAQQKAIGPMLKGAEITGSADAPNQAPGNLKAAVQPGKARATLTSMEKGAEELAQCEPVSGEQYQKAPQAKDLKPHVSIDGKEPPKLVTEKQAEYYALHGRYYPLDNYQQVKEASAYFEEYGRRLSPEDRHEYCVNVVKRASKMGIEVSETVRKYGSETYAPLDEVKIAFDMRRQFIEGPLRDMYDGLEEKIAEVQPEVFCDALSELDKLAEIDWMYDRNILDPYASTFGFAKTAEEDTWMQGNDYITRRQIENFGLTGYESLEASFGSDFADGFRKDPWGIFQSLPMQQKKMVARMAGDNSPTGKQHVA